MIVKLLEVCIAGVIVAIISMVVLIIAIIMAEFSEDIADWIREKVLKKKRGAKKPIYTNQGTVTRCPNCEAIHLKTLPSVKIDYCAKCGQAIDWSEVEYGK